MYSIVIAGPVRKKPLRERQILMSATSQDNSKDSCRTERGSFH